MVWVRCRTMSARARQHGIGLGFLGLHGNEAHGRALCGQGGGGGIIHVILLPLDEGFDIDRRDELAVMAHGDDLATPVMGAAAGLHDDQAWWDLREEAEELAA